MPCGRSISAQPDILANKALRRIAVGKSLKEIAAELSLSEKTVSTYRARITSKMGLSTNVELARCAMHHQLVD